MAGSRYAYTRTFELPDPLLPTTFFVIRLDGKGFHGFSKAHNFDKPNDVKALELMNMAAKRTMEGKELMGECVIGFGESDEYSFVFKRSCKLHGRRQSKLVTLVTSLFTSAYVFLWPSYFPNSPLQLDELPVFDGRIVQYSTELEVKDYLRWRQVDTHINNMYNTCFWALVDQAGMTAQEANKELSGTISSQKQELLFSRFGINYNNLPPMFRKGSVLVWEDEPTPVPTEASTEPATAESSIPSPSADPSPPASPAPLLTPDGRPRRNKKLDKKTAKIKRRVVVVHEDLIGEPWWEEGGRGAGILQG